MNNYQKEFIEKIIKKLKENINGMMHKEVLNKFFKNKNIEPATQCIHARSANVS